MTVCLNVSGTKPALQVLLSRGQQILIDSSKKHENKLSPVWVVGKKQKRGKEKWFLCFGKLLKHFSKNANEVVCWKNIVLCVQGGYITVMLICNG